MNSCLAEHDFGAPLCSTPNQETSGTSTPVLSEEMSRTGVDRESCALPHSDSIFSSSSAFRSPEPSSESKGLCSCLRTCAQFDSLYQKELSKRIEYIVAKLNRLVPMVDSHFASLENQLTALNETAKANDQIFSELANVSSEVRLLKKSRRITPTPISSSTAASNPFGPESFQSPVPGPETPLMSRAMSSGFMVPPEAGSRAKPLLKRMQTQTGRITPSHLETNGGMAI